MLAISPLSAAPLSALAELSTSTDRYVSASNSISISQNGFPTEVFRSLSSSIVVSQRSLVPFIDVFATSAVTLSSQDISAGQNANSRVELSQSAVTKDVYQTVVQSVFIASRCSIVTGYLASGRYRR